MTYKIIKKIILLGLLWRVVMFILATIAPVFLNYQPSFPYAYDLLAKLGLPQWLYSWANFDGVHYLTIMQKGYIGTGLIQAFFPFFPLLVRTFAFSFSHLILALSLNFLALIVALICLFLLVRRYAQSDIAWLTLILLLIFPSSFFLGAVYSEAFFLCFSLAAFLFAEKKNWWLATLAATLAIATRLVGIFILPALIVELLTGVPLQQLPAASKKNIKIILLLSFSLIGLFAYMAFLQKEFSDPFYFFHVQSEFGSGREEKLILLPQTLWRGIKIIFTVPFNKLWITYAQEIIFSLLALTTLIFGYYRRRQYKLPISWLIYAVGATVLPTLTGSLSSMPRYILTIFPLFYIWAHFLLKNRFARVILMVMSFALLIYNTILFIQGYWVA